MAGSAKLTVDFGDIALAAAALETERNLMNQNLAKVKSVINSLTRDGFKTDETSDALDSQIDKFKTNTGKATTALGQYAKFLRQASKTYRDIDDKLAKELGGSGVGERLTIDLGDVERLNANLKVALAALQDGGNSTAGLTDDVLGHAKVTEAVTKFDKDWDIRRGKLIESVDNLGRAYAAIVESMDEADSKLTSGLKGEGE